MSENAQELRSLAFTPTWSVACVLTIFVSVSLIVERSIHRLCNWLKRTDRKPLLAAVEKMKEELMLLGFISLLLTTTSSMISNICISSKLYNSVFIPCPKYEIDEEMESNNTKVHRLLMSIIYSHSNRRMLNGLDQNTCPKNFEPFVPYEGLEQLHRFIFVMTVTHLTYSCLTMLLAIVKVYGWSVWENEAHLDGHNLLSAITRALTMRRQSTFVRVHTSTPMDRNMFLIWVICFFRQFGNSVVRADYLTLRQGFITDTSDQTATITFLEEEMKIMNSKIIELRTELRRTKVESVGLIRINEALEYDNLQMDQRVTESMTFIHETIIEREKNKFFNSELIFGNKLNSSS